MTVSIERLTDMLGQAHTAGDVKGATFLSNQIRDFTPPDISREVKNEAGIENIPYVGLPARVLAQPFVYEAGTFASVLANTPEFVGRIPTQTFFSSLNYFQGNKKDIRIPHNRIIKIICFPFFLVSIQLLVFLYN